MLPDYVDLPSRSRMSIRSSWLGTGVAAAIIVMVALVFWALHLPRRGQSESPDVNYCLPEEFQPYDSRNVSL